MKKLLVVLAVLAVAGCSTFRRCEPQIQIQDHEVPVYVGVRIAVPECAELPDIPPYPGTEAAPEAKKAWALKLAEVRDQRDALNKGCIDALTLLINTVNDHADTIDEAWRPE
jgi:hypothetical protein